MKIKSYSMSKMKDRDITNLLVVMNEWGYGSNDFRVVHFGSHGVELKVMSQELHWKLKSLSRLERIKKSETA